MARKSSASPLDRLRALVGQLSSDECLALRPLLAARESAVEADMVGAQRRSAILDCPHCHAASFTKHGKCRLGEQRFLCKACKKTFTHMTTSALKGLHLKDKHFENVRRMLEGLSVRRVAESIGVDKNTAFRWRHKFLRAIIENGPTQLGAIVEVDETYFKRSYKGRKLPRGTRPRSSGGRAKKRGLSRKYQVAVLVARSRDPVLTFTAVLPRANTDCIDKVLSPLLAPGTVLCSDGAAMYPKLAAHHGLEHHAIPAYKRNARPKRRTDSLYNIQSMNAYTRDLKDWMIPFRGVSTHHLPSYLAWHRLLKGTKEQPTAREFFLKSHGS
ncbi:IS1595 family transposase [Lysobacter capsici]|uniref:IS1595 family transposase n=1 Tax=Lysobacter capsici TaxID=435897 RepID=UPI0007166ABA|nr:IS1595 family transposase [Lysobacter capsici]